ncbi:UNVERIFIED_CONTAM: hypothetical protein K2H54_048884 [Gekko kuhli]
MLVYLNALLSVVLAVRYSDISSPERTCNCSLNHIKSIDHIFLNCLEFLKLRVELISSLLSTAFASPTAMTPRLLSNVDGWLTYTVTRFLAAIVEIWKHYKTTT